MAMLTISMEFQQPRRPHLPPFPDLIEGFACKPWLC